MRMLKCLCTDQKGASAVEYAIVASLIAVAVLGGIATLGSKTGNMYNGVQNSMN